MQSAYRDSIYGEVRIDDPLLRELMGSQALQRLRGVLQHGVTALIGVTDGFSRYEHSVGAMLLVRRLGAGREEQIAALLHDVSHTAFSHVIDYVFGQHDGQTYHEEQKEAYVAGSDIPSILERHGYDWRDFLDEGRFALLEQDAPALCADRVDYFLRDLNFLGLADVDRIEPVLAALVAHDGRMVVTDLDVARWLAYTFIEADRASWSHPREVGLYQLTADAIRIARDQGELDSNDLWLTDRALWEKLRHSRSDQVRRAVQRVSPATRFVFDHEAADFQVAPKVRSIDPDVLLSGRLAPLSSLDRSFARFRDDYLASKRGSWPMRVASWL